MKRPTPQHHETITAFALYFLGGYVAGLSGAEWVVIFVLGLALIIVEMFVYPGTIIIGLLGATLMLAALIMAMVDLYPATTPGVLPAMPSFDKFELPLQNIGIATLGGGLAIWLASLLLPKRPMYRSMVSQSATGMRTEALLEAKQKSLQGKVGVTTSALRPGGKAQFGDAIIDVISQGEMLPKGTRVRVIGSSGADLRTMNRMNDTIPGCKVTGRIEMDGEDINAKSVDPVLLRARVGMVFQNPNPFPKTIYENVAYGPRIHGLAASKSELDSVVEASLKRAGLWEEVADRLHSPGTGLSGGQQQRLVIARAIAVEPEVILMDEPCSAWIPSRRPRSRN